MGKELKIDLSTKSMYQVNKIYRQPNVCTFRLRHRYIDRNDWHFITKNCSMFIVVQCLAFQPFSCIKSTSNLRGKYYSFQIHHFWSSSLWLLVNSFNRLRKCISNVKSVSSSLVTMKCLHNKFAKCQLCQLSYICIALSSVLHSHFTILNVQCSMRTSQRRTPILTAQFRTKTKCQLRNCSQNILNTAVLFSIEKCSFSFRIRFLFSVVFLHFQQNGSCCHCSLFANRKWLCKWKMFHVHRKCIK